MGKLRASLSIQYHTEQPHAHLHSNPQARYALICSIFPALMDILIIFHVQI